MYLTSNWFVIAIIISISQGAAAANKYYCWNDVCHYQHVDLVLKKYSYIPPKTRLLFVRDFDDINNTALLDSGVKQIVDQNGDTRFRRCFARPPFGPIVKKETYSGTDQSQVTQFENSTGLEKCLRSYCLGKHNGYFKCHDDNITSLSSNYENRTCFKKMRFVSIQSEHLKQIDSDNIFSDPKINWNIVTIIVKMSRLNKHIEIACNAFQYLRKLRQLLSPNSAIYGNLKCLFEYNPYLVSTSFHNLRIWNTCSETSDIWQKFIEYNGDALVGNIHQLPDKITERIDTIDNRIEDTEIIDSETKRAEEVRSVKPKTSTITEGADMIDNKTEDTKITNSETKMSEEVGTVKPETSTTEEPPNKMSGIKTYGFYTIFSFICVTLFYVLYSCMCKKT